MQWTTSTNFGTHDQAAAVLAKDGIPVYAWNGMTDEDMKSCIEDTLVFPDGQVCILGVIVSSATI